MSKNAHAREGMQQRAPRDIGGRTLHNQAISCRPGGGRKQKRGREAHYSCDLRPTIQCLGRGIDFNQQHQIITNQTTLQPWRLQPTALNRSRSASSIQPWHFQTLPTALNRSFAASKHSAAASNTNSTEPQHFSNNLTVASTSAIMHHDNLRRGLDKNNHIYSFDLAFRCNLLRCVLVNCSS